MKYSTLIEDMIGEGASVEMILVAVRAVERQEDDALERRRAADKARQAKHRLSRDITLGNVSHAPSRSRARVEDKTLTSEIEPQEESKNETRASALVAFETFWSAYPNKVGKPKARTALDTALGKAPLAAIMAGLQRYIASKPPDRQWMNPATFLNQERWGDQPATVAPLARAGPQNVNLSHLFATQERMENAQQIEPSETPVRYLSAANG